MPRESRPLDHVAPKTEPPLEEGGGDDAAAGGVVERACSRGEMGSPEGSDEEPPVLEDARPLVRSFVPEGSLEGHEDVHVGPRHRLRGGLPLDPTVAGGVKDGGVRVRAPPLPQLA